MRNFMLCLMALIVAPAWMSAQSVSGKVNDEGGLPLPGVTVKVVGAAQGTVTDFDGNFTVAASPGTSLEFSYLGYATQTVAAAANMTVKMKPAASELTEVVVIGYGTASKRDLTGSIVKVKGDEVANRPNVNPLNSLQGKVTGLTIVNSGQPGSEPDIRIRGTVSRYRTKPLYVIDGIWNDTMDFVNPGDIESIEVLKDPSSLAIFGARGANGVIIVSTKKGKVGKTVVNFSSSIGVKKITGKPDMTNGPEFRALYDQQRQNQGAAPYAYYNYFNADTDWIDEISQQDPTVSITNVSVSSGTDNNRLYIGAGYVNEQGLIKNEQLKRFTFNINDELQVNNWLKVGASMSGYDARLPQLHDFISALNATPLVAPFNDAKGLYNQLPIDIGGAQIGNPLAAVEVVQNGTQLNRDTRYVGNAFAEVKIFDGLKARFNYLADLGFSRGRSYLPVFNVYAAETDEATPYGGTTQTVVNQFKTDSQKTQQEALLTYQKEFGKHDLTLLGGYTRQEGRYSTLTGQVKENPVNGHIPNDPRWWYVNVYPYGDPTTRVANSDEYLEGYQSLLARALYNYDGKYIFNASFRRDFASSIGKWQSFWAFGAAWEISKEAFMQNSAFQLLKIKGSYGELGNAYTGDDSASKYIQYPLFQTGSPAIFGQTPGVMETQSPAFVLSYEENAGLKWEAIVSKEGGVEFATMKNRLSGEVNYYHKETKDLLNFVGGGISDRKYFFNSGNIINKGLEVSLNWNDKIGQDWSYRLGGNLTTIYNRVTSVNLGQGIKYLIDGPTIFAEGAPIGAFYGYEVEGVYQSYADILASPPSALGSYDVGDLKFKDLNGDGKITTDDRKVIGNPTPDFTYAFNAGVNYKGWSLDADFQGVYGNEVFRSWGNGATYAQFNYRSDRLGAWNGAGSSNWEPRLNDASGYNTNNVSNYMIEDGSYLRLRNIQLAYSFNSNTANAIGLQNFRIYLSGQNLVTWKNNSGFTPEFTGNPAKFGIDYGGYPIPAITAIGLNATF